MNFVALFLIRTEKLVSKWQFCQIRKDQENEPLFRMDRFVISWLLRKKKVEMT